MRAVPRLATALAGALAGYVLVVRGDLTLDVGVGRRERPLGPIRVEIDAPRETVFDVVAAPYLGRTPRAMQTELRVLERGADMVLAEHFTAGGPLTTTTVETVRFERPERVSFRLVRGPVPEVVETFELHDRDGATELVYAGTMGTDFWALGRWWGDRVAEPWERTVSRSLGDIGAEAERRAGRRRH